MTGSSRALRALTLAVALLGLTGCNPGGRDAVTPQTQSTLAPYPADMEHLDDILALSKMELPENVDEVTVEPAYEFERGYPRGWGYVVYFTADEAITRQFLSDYVRIILPEAEDYPDCDPELAEKDLPVAEVNRPICASASTGTGNARVLVERPFGRVWILIRGE
mgnify:CR=1 FL=1